MIDDKTATQWAKDAGLWPELRVGLPGELDTAQVAWHTYSEFASNK